MTYDLSSSTVIEASPEATYDAMIETPLQDLFVKRSGPIGAIRDMRDHVGQWGTVGAARTVVQVDGSTTRETMVLAERPGEFRYELTDLKGPFKLLVKKVDGRFTFVPEGTGTRVTWSWALHPTSPITALALPPVGFFWRGWATKMWAQFASRV